MSLPRFTALVRGMRENPRAIWPVAAIMVIGLGVFSFFSIADEVAEGEIAAIDEWLFYLLRSAASSSQGGPRSPRSAAIR
jgi:undecaprenyl-diphosphatase